jgi:hypothetical protein
MRQVVAQVAPYYVPVQQKMKVKYADDCDVEKIERGSEQVVKPF